MTVKIGEKIKELRRKSNVTQEKFAEYLGVTAQAVSRWEVEGCYPDLELLAPIANFFNITIDELMGFDIIKNQERIENIFELAHQKAHKGLVNEQLEIMRNAVQEFPNNYKLLAHLAHVLGIFHPQTEEERQKNIRESIAINERILADCTDDEIRYGVLQKLAFGYNSIGEKEKAVTTAKKLPHMSCTWNAVITHIYEGNELYEFLVNDVPAYMDILNQTLDYLAWTKYKEAPNKKIMLYKKAVGIIELIWEDGDYGFYNCRLAEYYMEMAKSYIVLNDIENTLDCLEKSVKYAVAYDTAEKFKYTSVIFEDTNYDPAGSSKRYDYNDCYRLLYTYGLTGERFYAVKDNDRYKAVIAELEKYAKKEN